MAHGHKAQQLACPAAIARRPKNVFVSHFQIAFRFETDRSQGTMTCGAPEEKYVGIFGRLHATPCQKEA